MDIRTWIIIVLSILLVFCLAGIGYLFLLVDDPMTGLADPDMASPTPNPNLPSDITRTEIDVYFPTNDYMKLKSETRSVEQPASIEERVTVSLDELLKGPRSRELIQVIPTGTKVQSVFWSEPDSLVVVSFSQELLQNKPSHSLGEWALIYSIVNTIVSHSTAIENVNLLVDGHVAEARNTHWDWTSPFRKENTFVHLNVDSTG